MHDDRERGVKLSKACKTKMKVERKQGAKAKAKVGDVGKTVVETETYLLMLRTAMGCLLDGNVGIPVVG